ncbi:hypothetical protein AAFG13_17355 [Bradyrhizobium sp. B124]|uniref:hypothetical protein n=1 Tax=Bradyrhizobium sp. B124 TaxID=3140245 RepID=UPI003183FDF9
MPTGYYAYFIGPDGHIQDRVVILVDDDEEAKSLARQLVDGHDIELWQGARKVAALPSEK